MLVDSNYVLMFAGGGTRYAIYGGVYQALEEAGICPSYIIASCGGAITSTVINAFKSNEERKEYFKSKEFYEFIRSLKLAPSARLDKLPIYCIGKLFNRRSAPTIEDIIGRYIVDMPTDISKYLPSLNIKPQGGIPTIVIACKASFLESEVNKPRNGKKIFKRLLITDPKTASILKQSSDYASYKDSAIELNYDIVTDIDPIVAMRISGSDMFYVPPVCLNGEYYFGGAADLVPIELALSLAKNVIVERKQRYTLIEEALIRSVFGFSANARLNECESKYSSLVIDTMDNEQALKNNYIGRSINWFKLRVEVKNNIPYDKFCVQIDVQWQYGYERTKKMLDKL